MSPFFANYRRLTEYLSVSSTPLQSTRPRLLLSSKIRLLNFRAFDKIICPNNLSFPWIIFDDKFRSTSAGLRPNWAWCCCPVNGLLFSRLGIQDRPIQKKNYRLHCGPISPMSLMLQHPP